MRSKKNVQTVELERGETLTQTFDNYIDMATSAVDWTLFCTYQLKPIYSEGLHRILQLPSMQIAYTKMTGGIMFDYASPEGTLTFSVISEMEGKACIEQMKLQSGMIAVVNDKKRYNFVHNGEIEIFDVSLNANADSILYKMFKEAVDCYYLDTDGTISTLLKKIIAHYGKQETLDESTSRTIEAQVTQTVRRVLETQEPQTYRFPNSEKTAMEIKRYLFTHMDHTKSLSELSREYDISERSLQNAFKSLFGITPNHFMRTLKLNLVHHELTRSKPREISIQRSAQKWGFLHMGHFAKYYRELFKQSPSDTLQKITEIEDGMKEHCVERKEEML